MKFLKLDKKKGSGGPSIKSRYAYLIYLDDIDYLPSTDDKGVRLEGDIVLKEDCKMMPLYLTSSSQEFSYDILGDDDEKSYLVKFSGTHPGTELEALEFAKNMIEQPFLVLIPSCNETEPWKLLGELTNPLIFTSSHKSGKEGSKFTFNFEQRIGSEFIYFSYGGVEVPSGGEGVDPPGGGFDPTKWAKRNAENITDENVILWREALRIYEEDKVLQIGPITATTTTLTLDLHTSGVNSVLLSGVERSKTEGDDFTFAPVSAGKLKYVLLYALPDPQLFHIIEGAEGTEAVEPAYSGLLVARLLVTEEGIDIVEAVSGFREKSVDNFAIYSLLSGDRVIGVGANMRLKVQSAGAVRIGGFVNEEDKLYNGCPISVRNDTPFPMEFYNAVDASPEFIAISSADLPFSIKAGETANFAYRGGIVEIIKTGGSGGGKASEVENDSTVTGASVKDALETINSRTSNVVDKMLHYWDATAGKWLSSGVEFISDKFLKLKIIAFGGYTIAQKNAIVSPIEGMLIYQNESPKGFQKYENNSWSPIENSINKLNKPNESVEYFTNQFDKVLLTDDSENTKSLIGLKDVLTKRNLETSFSDNKFDSILIKEGYSLNGVSGNEVVLATTSISNFIPCKVGEVWRINSDRVIAFYSTGEKESYLGLIPSIDSNPSQEGREFTITYPTARYFRFVIMNSWEIPTIYAKKIITIAQNGLFTKSDRSIFRDETVSEYLEKRLKPYHYELRKKIINASIRNNDIIAAVGDSIVKYGLDEVETVLLTITSVSDWRCVWTSNTGKTFFSPMNSYSNATSSSNYGLYMYDGATVTKVITLGNRQSIWGITEDDNGNIYAGSYDLGGAANPVIYKSTDRGITFTSIYTFTGFKHIHDVYFCPFNKSLYACVGDLYQSTQNFKSIDGGITWLGILTPLKRQMTAVTSSSKYRFFGSDHSPYGILWRTSDDNILEESLNVGYYANVFFLRRSDITGWLYVGFKTDPTTTQFFCSIWVSKNNGDSWEIVKEINVVQAGDGFWFASNFKNGNMIVGMRNGGDGHANWYGVGISELEFPVYDADGITGTRLKAILK